LEKGKEKRADDLRTFFFGIPEFRYFGFLSLFRFFGFSEFRYSGIP